MSLTYLMKRRAFLRDGAEDVVFVLAGVHAAAEFVAAGPEGAVEFGFP